MDDTFPSPEEIAGRSGPSSASAPPSASFPSPDDFASRGTGVSPAPIGPPAPAAFPQGSPTPVGPPPFEGTIPQASPSLTPPSYVPPQPDDNVLTNTIGPTGSRQTRGQLRRRVALHKSLLKRPIETRLEPTPGNVVGAFGVSGAEQLYNVGRFAQDLMHPERMPVTAAESQALSQEFFEPAKEASPTAALAGSFFGQAPVFMAGGPAAEALAPKAAASALPYIGRILGETPLAQKVAGHGAEATINALMDALLVQPTLPTDMPLKERALQTAIAPATGLATRLAGGAVRAGAEKAGIPDVHLFGRREPLPPDVAAAPPPQVHRLKELPSPRGMRPEQPGERMAPGPRPPGPERPSFTRRPNRPGQGTMTDEAFEAANRPFLKGPSAEEPTVTFRRSSTPTGMPGWVNVEIDTPAGRRATMMREAQAPTGETTVPLSQAPEGVRQQFQVRAEPLDERAARAREMSARLPGEAQIPGNVGPQGEMGGRQIYNEPTGSTKALPAPELPGGRGEQTPASKEAALWKARGELAKQRAEMFPEQAAQAERDRAEALKEMPSIYEEGVEPKDVERYLDERKARREAAAQPEHVPFSTENLKKTFGLSHEQAAATEALADTMGLDKSRLKLTKGGTPSPEALKQEKNAPIWYSKLRKTVEEKMPKAMDAEQLRAMLKSAGVKPEEMEWSRVEDLHGKISKDDVLRHLEDQSVQIKEVMHGGRRPTDNKKPVTDPDNEIRLEPFINANGGTDYHSWVHGERFRDVGSYRGEQDARARVAHIWNIEREDVSNPATKYGDYLSSGEHEHYRELLLTMLPSEKAKPSERGFTPREQYENAPSTGRDIFHSAHWDEPNILAHVRFNDRIAPDGKRVLFIEEIQSDWHQKGRRLGYKKVIPIEEKEAVIEKVRDLKRPVNLILEDHNLLGFDSYREAYNAIIGHDDWAERWDVGSAENQRIINEYRDFEIQNEEALREARGLSPSVDQPPNAPFKRSWHDLAMKRMIRYAAENGYDRIAWTTGEMQAERYSLSKHVDSMTVAARYDPVSETPSRSLSINIKHGRTIELGLDPEGKIDNVVGGEDNWVGRSLGEVIGEEMADKILTGPINGHYAGEGLKIGGLGMKGFYDKILPSDTQKLIRKYGGKVEKTGVPKERSTRTELEVWDNAGETIGTFPDTFEGRDAADRLAREHEGTWNYVDVPYGSETHDVHSFDVTPEMRSEALSQGMPLFQKGKASVEFPRAGEALIRSLSSPDVSSGVHELAHVARRFLLDSSIPSERRVGITDAHIKAAEDWAGVKNGKWTRGAEEKFASGFERYLRDGQAPTPRLGELFSKFKEWLGQIYTRLSGTKLDLKISKAMRGVYDALVTRGEEPAGEQGLVLRDREAARPKQLGPGAGGPIVPHTPVSRFYSGRPPDELDIEKHSPVSRFYSGEPPIGAEVGRPRSRRPPPEPRSSDLGISRWFGDPAFVLTSRRYARTRAGRAINDIHLTEERIHRQAERNLTENYLAPLDDLPKDARAEKYRLIADLIENPTSPPGSLAAQWKASLDPRIKTAVGKIKEAFERDRQRIMADMRARGFDPPADWGPADYLPHFYPGEYRIYHTDPVSGRKNLIGSAYNKLDALSFVRQFTKDNPNVKASDLSVGSTPWVPPDITRVSNPNRWRIINEIADAAQISHQDVADALAGKLGAKEFRRKFFGSVLKRRGAAGYTQDLPYIFQRYTQGLERHLELSKLNRRVQPILRTIRNRGLTNLANEVESNLNMLWGVRSQVAQDLDATLAKTPGLNLIHRYGALERWTGRLRGSMAFLQLKTLRFQLMQKIQLAQTLYPVVGAKQTLRAVELFGKKEGQDILTRHGVKYGISRWTESQPMIDRLLGKVQNPQVRMRLQRLREKLNSETMNQQIAFLALHDEGTKRGMSDARAADYARLRGQFMTQFYPLVSDQPAIMRGPIGRTVFQYRRFQVKNITLGMRMLREGNYPAAARWLGVNLLLGGGKMALKLAPIAGAALVLAPGDTAKRIRQAPAYFTLKTYNAIKEKYGENAADVLMFGLPGLLGLDLSNSVQMIDAPYGDNLPEKVGNLVLGPSGQLATSAIAAGQAMPGPDAETGPTRITREMIQRVPMLKMIDGVRRIFEKDYDFTTSDGRLKYKSDWKEVLKQTGSFRSVERGQDELFIDAMTQLGEARSKAINESVAAAQGGDMSRARKIVVEWNGLWPEVPIGGTDIRRRFTSKQQTANVPLIPRLLKQQGKPIERALRPEAQPAQVP